MTTTRTVSLDDIVIGDRRREDYGDLDGLAASIGRYGLLHPPVVDDQLRLVAGERRIRAARSLGWTEIDVRLLGDITEAERREIELQENLHRKDLTSYERNKTLVALAETAAEIDRSELRAESARKSRGRPVEPGSLRRVADRIDVPVKTIHEAQAHVETAEAFPFMQKADWKQYHVLQAKEAIDQLPEPERPKVAALVDKPATPPSYAIRMIRNVAEMPAQKRAEIYRLDQSPDVREQSLALTTAIELPPMPDPRLTRLDRAIREIEAAIEPFPDDPETPVLEQVIETLRSIKAEIRKVAA